MYYQTLLTLKKKYQEKIIEKYDFWLYNLPKREDDRISIGKLANELKIEFIIAKNILEDSVRLNILEHRYAIKCPECGHVIVIVTIEELYNKISEIENCDACETENIKITDEEIQVLYKKIDNGNYEDKKKEIDPIKEVTETDTLKGFIQDKIIKPNDIFYKPTQEEKERMIELFERIGKKSSNTTEKGNQLRDYVEYVLRIVKVFEAANIRTRTNELDCLVKNKLYFASPYFLNELGNILIVECKNEKEKPDNSYFLKLKGILGLCKGKCGIIVAIQEPTKPALQIANKVFLQEDIFIIAINYEELKNITYNDLNFLDLLENKIISLKLDATTYMGDNKIFE